MKRIQYKRAKPLPPDAIYVGRPSRWGNPYQVKKYGRDEALRLYNIHLTAKIQNEPDFLTPLAGRDLACWCKLDEACHADILMRLCNLTIKP